MLALSPLAASGQLLKSFGSERAGTSGYQFLKIPVDPRSAALGETVASNGMDASALFWNPALAAQTTRSQIGFSHTAYFADVTMEYVAGIVHLHRLGIAVGASVQALDSGRMDVTTEFEPFGTGQTFRFTDLAAGLTLSQRLTDLFSYGVTAKYLRESTAGLTASSVVFDLGIFYRVGESGAQMAVAIRNFGLDGQPQGSIERIGLASADPIVESDFESLTPPTTFLLGITYQVLGRNGGPGDLFLSGQLNNPNDSAESFNIGAEYVWTDRLFIRGGYRFGVEEYALPSVGFGVAPPIPGIGLRLDYGFSRLDRLGSVHRIGMNLGL